eukprot:14022402-Alexandrium_andersonii.AAC.1
MLMHSWIPPHKWMQFLWQHFRQSFKERLLGPEGALQEFWAGVKPSDPKLIHSPVRDHPRLRTHGIPIMLHGDGVPCTRKNTLECISWQSILAVQSTDHFTSTLDSIFLAFAVYAKTMVEDGSTKKVMWQALVQSLLAAEEGVDPVTKQPLAGGYFCVVWALKADMEFFINHYGMPGFWNSKSPCSSCPCTKDMKQTQSPMKWSNFAMDAPWKQQCFVDNDTWAAHCIAKKKPPHQLFQPRSQNGFGLCIAAHQKDVLHVVCLGILPHLLGN